MPIPSSDRKKYAPARRVALDAALLAAALMLSYLEHLLPFGALTLLPYFKPGCANVIPVLAFSLLSPLDALAVSLLRVGITGVLFGSWTSLFFSFCGACMAFLALLLAQVQLPRRVGPLRCGAQHGAGSCRRSGYGGPVPQCRGVPRSSDHGSAVPAPLCRAVRNSDGIHSQSARSEVGKVVPRMKKRITGCILALCFLLFGLAGCSADRGQTEEFWGMGTSVSVTLYGTAQAKKEGFALARATVSELDGLWSLTISDSDISRLNASADGISDADTRTVALIQQAKEISALTDGSFDITLAPLTALWKKCGEEDRLPTDEELAVRLAAVGTSALTAEGTFINKPRGTEVDLGAIAKGAAISALRDRLKALDGLDGGLISMGSCVTVFGAKPNGKPFRVSVRDPHNRADIAGTLTLEDGQVLSVSGDYERFVTIGGKQYHHILDPATGYPSDSGLSSVAVISRDGATADALSTAFMVMGENAARTLYDSGNLPFASEAVFFRSDGSVSVTESTDFQKR